MEYFPNFLRAHKNVSLTLRYDGRPPRSSIMKNGAEFLSAGIQPISTLSRSSLPAELTSPESAFRGPRPPTFKDCIDLIVVHWRYAL